MHREDNSKYLLYIEPKSSERLEEPIDDELTNIMGMALEQSTAGTTNYRHGKEGEEVFYEGSGYRGIHLTECGVSSSNKDYLLDNGMITNSLATYYVRWYRNSIPETEMKKLEELKMHYKNLKKSNNNSRVVLTNE